MVIEARENGNLSKKQRAVIDLTIFYEGFRVLNPQPLNPSPFMSNALWASLAVIRATKKLSGENSLGEQGAGGHWEQIAKLDWHFSPVLDLGKAPQR